MKPVKKLKTQSQQAAGYVLRGNNQKTISIFPSLPNRMDKILKEHFDRFMKKGELPPELQQLNGEVKLFDNEELLKTWRSNFKGIQ